MASALLQRVHRAVCLERALLPSILYYIPLRTHTSQPQPDDGSGEPTHDTEHMQVPGHNVPCTSRLGLFGGVSDESPRPYPIPAFRVMTPAGLLPAASREFVLPVDTALRIYKTMLQLQVVDTVFFEAQRQGRFSFYMTSTGEEASVVASAAALDDKDDVFGQYREQGVFLWRGFTVRQMADQCFGNLHDDSKGRQMPVHYGSKELHIFSISSPLGTQLPHAVGAAYALKLQKTGTVAVAYFGEGCSSVGDAHAAFNFAATLRCPVVFICRNNGYAISTPAEQQFVGPGIAERGPGYGMPSVRVDGRDAMAVYAAVKQARAVALRDSTPVLVEVR